MLPLDDLIKPLTRDERQHEAVDKWIACKGHATVVGCTGFGTPFNIIII